MALRKSKTKKILKARNTGDRPWPHACLILTQGRRRRREGSGRDRGKDIMCGNVNPAAWKIGWSKEPSASYLTSTSQIFFRNPGRKWLLHENAVRLHSRIRGGRRRKRSKKKGAWDVNPFYSRGLNALREAGTMPFFPKDKT